VAASNDILDYVHDAPMAEAYALRNGIYFALSLGCSRVIVNSDCMDVIETMLNGGQSGGSAASVFEECNRLSQDFQRIIFEHCSREMNRVAHMLASFAK
jgi:hypothetical protein